MMCIFFKFSICVVYKVKFSGDFIIIFIVVLFTFLHYMYYVYDVYNK